VLVMMKHAEDEDVWATTEAFELEELGGGRI
jgi:hypothetical protein